MPNTHVPQFPPTETALNEPNGLLAAGGQLTPLWLYSAYRQGIFPWNDPEEVRLWWSPAPRAVITPASFRLPRTVRKLIRRQTPLVTCNFAFNEVIHACAEPREDDGGTWIDPEILTTYPRLYAAGQAISVEIWSTEGELTGGFYGVVIGSCLFGESMFSRQPNASKLAFALAAPYFFHAGIQLIDCQMTTNHLSQFGANEVERTEFEQQLRQYCITPLQRSLRGIIHA